MKFSWYIFPGQLFKKTGKLLKLSEQQLLDCARGPDYSRNKGCKGGVVSSVFDYVKLNGVTENSTYPYPYQANDTFSCSYKPSTSVTKLNNYFWPQNIDEVYLKNLLVKIGPLSVRNLFFMLKNFTKISCLNFLKICVDASQKSFINYKSGVYNDESCSQEDVNQ